MNSTRFGARVAVVVVSVVALAVFAGCGGNDGEENGGGAGTSASGSDEQVLRETIRDFYASFQNPAEYCGFLSERLQRNGGRERCEEEQQRYADAGQERELKETEITIRGTRATAENTVETSSGSTGRSTQQWVKEGGQWKLDG